jgi:two-component system nitrogen regulation sensor histidine kinase NtrY
MNALPPRRLSRRADGEQPSLLERLPGKLTIIVLAGIALVTGVATFILLSGGLSFTNHPRLDLVLLGANALAIFLLGLALAARLGRVWLDRRRGLAGARLHVRLVMLFSVVAVTPTVVVALFATVLFQVGIQAWFNDRVRTALAESLQAARGYLTEHNDVIRADAINLAEDLALAHAGELIFSNPEEVTRILFDQSALNGLSQAVIFDPVTGQVMASMSSRTAPLPPPQALLQARTGAVSILDSPDHTTVSALIALQTPQQLMLMIARPVDATILGHMERTEQAVGEYNRLDRHRSHLQITFVLIFALVALLVLSAAILIGLVLANQIARPLGALIVAAERVRTGDLGVRVPERGADDEVAGLSRAFNRMTDQLAAQRTELMAAYSQIDERRRFTETVLSGVSAGVIGLDAGQRIELPNRVASELLGTDLLAAVARKLDDVAPEFAPLLLAASEHPERAHTAEVQSGPAGKRRTLLVQIGVEQRHEHLDGFVVTFDDITELQAAQRKAAWADIARRIAHEIKNPLTPIQLSAERLKRRFLREITSDPDTFVQCADTIVRHVGDIGRMVDEFSAFARMPQPAIKPEDIGRVAREALVLQRDSRPWIDWRADIPANGPIGPCDRRLIGQALTNLLLNAVDAISMSTHPQQGRIALSVRIVGENVMLSVEDDGIGLPAEDHARLTEPYVTHKLKGTGLGLAIVKKIMEDHGGSVTLSDRADGIGAVATLTLPVRDSDGA